MMGIFSQADELFLFGLAIPFDDALIFGAGVDVLGSDLEACDAEGVSLILNALSEAIHCV